MNVQPQPFSINTFINQADTILKSKEPENAKHEKLKKLFQENASAIKNTSSEKLSDEQSAIFHKAHTLANWKPGKATVAISPDMTARDVNQAQMRSRNFPREKKSNS